MEQSAVQSQKPKLILHWLEFSRSHRILWLLEELGLEYEIKLYHRDKKTRLADPALAKIHPLGKSPVLEDGDKIIAESGLIIDYLITNYGQKSELIPKTADDQFQVKYYLYYAEASLQPTMLLLFISQTVRNGPMPFFIRPIARKIMDQVDASYAGPDAVKNLKYLESQLKSVGTGYFVGNTLTGADIILSFPLEMAVSRAGLNSTKYPLLSKWIDDIHSREAYKRANEKISETGFAKNYSNYKL
ncbi:glutathione S-transferase [Dipodascopsis uninucleata]